MCFSSQQHELSFASLIDVQNFVGNENGCAAVIDVPLWNDDSEMQSASMENLDEAVPHLSVPESLCSNISRVHSEICATSMKRRDCQNPRLDSESLSSLDIKQSSSIAKNSRVCSVEHLVKREGRNHHSPQIATAYPCVSSPDLRIPPNEKESDTPWSDENDVQPSLGILYSPSWASNYNQTLVSNKNMNNYSVDFVLLCAVVDPVETPFQNFTFVLVN